MFESQPTAKWLGDRLLQGSAVQKPLSANNTTAKAYRSSLAAVLR